MSVAKPIERSEGLEVVILTNIPSPYQIELFNEIAARGVHRLHVVYLSGSHRDRQWERGPMTHPYSILNEGASNWRESWTRLMNAPLVVFAYYTHPFALAALTARAWMDLPWVFWGERPGALRLGVWSQWLRRLLLRPLKQNPVPIWGIGNFALQGYKQEFGNTRHYENIPYASRLNAHLAIQRAMHPDLKIPCRFLFSGALIRRKGLVSLAEAFLKLAQVTPEVTLTIMGDGPLRPTLERILKPVRDKVSWLGFVPWTELVKGYSDADVLCIPSRYDGWGMVVVEAMAAGIPVIASQKTGAGLELIRHNENGWLIPADDDSALYEVMHQAVNMGSARRMEMGKSAREVASGYNADLIAAKFQLACSRAAEGIRSVTNAPNRVRVMLVANYTPDHQFSMQRYGALLEQHLHAAGIDVTLVRPTPRLGHLLKPKQFLGRFLGYIDKFILFSFELAVRAVKFNLTRPGIIHVIDQGNGVYMLIAKAFPHVVTCHDLISVKQGGGRNPASMKRRSGYQSLNRVALRMSQWFVCVSHATRDDALRILDVSANNCVVIHNPLDPRFLETATDRPSGVPNSYFLHVGSGAWYKNRSGLFRIQKALRDLGVHRKLVLMGEPLTPEERIVRDELGIGDDVLLLQAPSDKQIQDAYAHAECLIFPSIEEGFGWPILEGLSQGCLVFTTNRRPMTEAGGSAAVYFDPEDPIECARTIIRTLDDTSSHSAMREAGRQHAAQFTISKFEKEYEHLYRRILKERSPVDLLPASS